MSELTQEYWKEFNKKQALLREKVTQDPWRLTYHQMPETGWLNDPNGVVQFQGTYHLYHQYAPVNPEGGLVHWGHKTSDDLVHFEEHDIFLSPDQMYNKDGAYSGSAIVKDDDIHFFYTGNVKNPGEHDYTFSGREQNTVHMVSKDGFSVDEREVVIHHGEYPEGFTDHIRDPKVFEKEGTYYMILGARALDHRGKILLYTSKDLYDWTYQGIFAEAADETMGYMWECPDFFETSEKDVLIFSPQGIQATKPFVYQNVYQSGYYLGQVDYEEGQFIPENEFQELDYGFDFYAPQTFEDENGRRILWAWMGIGDTAPEYSNPTVHRGWQHALTMPRELTVENNELKQRPLPEYQALRQNETQETLTIDKQAKFPVAHQDAFELLLDVSEMTAPFSITLKEDTKLSYDGEVFRMQHGLSGYGRSTRGIAIEDITLIHIFADTSSLEIFLNDGSYVMTSRVYPKENREDILFEGQGTLSFTRWDLIKE